jgi:hypothetical protein
MVYASPREIATMPNPLKPAALAWLLALAIPLVLSAQDEAPPKPIRFEKGKTSAVVRGTLTLHDGWTEPVTYSLRAAAGQVMKVRFVSEDEKAWYSVACPGNGGTNSRKTPLWTYTLPESGEYRIAVGSEGDAKSIPYTLEVEVAGKPHPVKVRGVTGTYQREDDSFVEAVELPDGQVRFYLQAYWKGPNWKEYGPNLGEVSGTVPLKNGKAVYRDEDCTLDLAFDKTTLRITEKGDCGFGHSVTAEGTYRKTSACAAPERFEEGGKIGG